MRGIVPDLSTPENREYWEFVREVKRMSKVKLYGCTAEEWDALTTGGKMLVMSAYICELNTEITDRTAKIKRLTDRGIEDMKHRIVELTGIIANVHDELHDPMGEYWCDRPPGDRELLEALRDRVDEAMGWDKEA